MQPTMSKRTPSETSGSSRSGASTKSDRREQARHERRELVRRAAVRRKRRRLAIVVLSVAAVAGIAVGVVLAATGGGSKGTEPKGLPGLQTSVLQNGETWPPEYDHLKDRLTALGLPVLGSEATTIHHHDLLQVFIHGKEVTVPALVGIDESAGYLTSLHTHDTSGIIHVESPTPRTFTLGEVFDVWGVRFTPSCVGGYCSSDSDQLRVYVNGKAVGGDPRTIELTQHEDIVVVFGSTAELPDPIPSTYSKSLSESCAPDC
jgi:hypothetical protein